MSNLYNLKCEISLQNCGTLSELGMKIKRPGLDADADLYWCGTFTQILYLSINIIK